MKRIISSLYYFFTVLTIVIYVNSVQVYAQEKDFKPGIIIQADNVDIGRDKQYTVPCIVDWDEDGKKDLLVGCFYNGYIYYYRNIGENDEPVFNSGDLLQEDGSVLTVAYG